MANYDKGILGPFRGRVGSVVGSFFRGRPIMKSKGPSTRKNNKPRQIIQQTKFKMTSQLIKGFKRLFEITYAVNAQGQTPRNRALGQIITNAITGTYPDLKIEHSKIMISAGSLQKPISPSASFAPGNERIVWKWNNDTNRDGSNPDDLSVVVAYCPAYNNALFSTKGVSRGFGYEGMPMEVTTFEGQTIHTYLAFISPDGLSISDSIYTGKFEVPIL